MNIYFPLNNSHLLKSIILAVNSGETCTIFMQSGVRQQLNIGSVRVVFNEFKYINSFCAGNFIGKLPNVGASVHIGFDGFKLAKDYLLFDLTDDYSLINDASKIYLFHDGHPISKAISQLRKDLILVEDGLANYVVKNNNFIQSLCSLLVGRGWNVRVMGDALYYKKLILSHDELFHQLPSFIKRKVEYVCFNRLFRNNFKLVMDFVSAIYPGIEKLELCDGVLLLTQPFERDFPQYKMKDRVCFFENLSKTLFDKYKNVTVKLHPSENYSDYNFSSEVKVISGKYPLELLVYNHQVKFDMAIGVYSTATSIKGLALKQINLLSNEDWINKSNFIKGNTLDDKWSKNVY